MFLNGLSERTPFEHSVTIPSNSVLSDTLMEERTCYYIKPELLTLGMVRKKTTFGNEVRCYDAYILGTTQEYDKEIYKEALKATAEHRGSTEQISDVEGFLKQISESDDLKDMWKKYQKKFAYASDISYENILEVLRMIVV